MSKTPVQVDNGLVLKYTLKQILNINSNKRAWLDLVALVKEDDLSGEFKEAFKPFKNKHSVSIKIAKMILKYVDSDWKEKFEFKWEN